MILKNNHPLKKQKKTVSKQLSQYRILTKSFLTTNEHREKVTHTLKSGLANILPLAAVSLSPFVMHAQPCAGSPPGAGSVQGTGCNNSQSIKADIDGSGYDVVMVMLAAGPSFRKATAASMTFARTLNGSFAYLIGYDNMVTINSASGSFGSLNSQPGGMACNVSTDEYGWLDYEATGNGGWNGLTGGTRSVGLIKDNKLGFIEFTYNDNTNVISIGEFGLASETTATLPTIGAGDCGDLLLPVVLTHFYGKKMEKGYMLLWQTSSEINNEGFEIQRSTDGENYRKIGWVEGAGNSADVLNYTFEDRALQPNQVYYYRLKQMDYDGKFEYSRVITHILTDHSAINVKDFSPNPVSQSFADLRIISPGSLKTNVVVLDAMGKSIFEKQTTLINGMHTIRLDLSNATSGTYFVQILVENGERYFKKLIVTRD